MKQTSLILLGATIGGFMGYLLFHWLISQGLYGIMIPGSALGFGASIPSNRSKILGAFCGLCALFLGFYSEWREFPFIADPGFSYFMTHLGDLKTATLIMIGIGGGAGFWLPYTRIVALKYREAAQPPKADSDS